MQVYHLLWAGEGVGGVEEEGGGGAQNQLVRETVRLKD